MRWLSSGFLTDSTYIAASSIQTGNLWIASPQDVYKFNQANFQISRRDFKKNPGHVCLALASYVMHRIYYYLMEYVMIMHFIQHGAVAKIK